MAEEIAKGGGTDVGNRELTAREKHESAVMNYRISEQYGYMFVMDVKDIRDSRYYKELGYSEFNNYCKEAWGVDKWYINERIKIADEFTEEDFGGYNHRFGHRKSLLLARMDEDVRIQALEEGIPTDKGAKPYEEATQKEINDFRRKLKEAEKQTEAERKERERLEVEVSKFWQKFLRVGTFIRDIVVCIYYPFRLHFARTVITFKRAPGTDTRRLEGGRESQRLRTYERYRTD